ncbi:MAG: Gfo/Idh/MocA family oxidoreductase [Actinomycetota bacterium]|nr:Gfo/Idh/MocA family oxidoreductase [Actinomycetota bacterium]
MIARPERWRAAIVGAGFIARHHLDCLRTLRGVDIVAVCDRSRAVADAMAERYGIAQTFTNHQAMLETVAPNVVHVTTPPISHASIALDAIDAGAHVVIEKPITVTHEEWLDVRDRAAASGRWVLEDQNLRFDPTFLRLLGLIDDGALGVVRHVDARFYQAIGDSSHPFGDRNCPHPNLRLPGGPIFDFLPHLASLAYAIVGDFNDARPTWTPASEGPLPYDRFAADLKCEKGTATLSFDAVSQPDGFWIDVFGDRAQATVNFYDGRLVLRRAAGGGSSWLAAVRNGLAESMAIGSATVTSLWEKVAGGPATYRGLWTLIEQFYAGLGACSQPPMSLDEIDAVSRMVAGCVTGLTGQ